MFMTLFALIIALFMGFLSPTHLMIDPSQLFVFLLTGGITLLILTFFVNTFILIPMEQLEQKLIPNLINLLGRDFILHWERIFLLVFSLLSFIGAVIISSLALHHQHWFFLGWIVAFGLALDVLRDNWHRLLNFLNPSYLLHQMTHKARKAIQNDQDDLFWDNLDGIAEVGLRSVENSRSALGTQALQSFPSIMNIFFTSAKSISHIHHDRMFEKEQEEDEASYTIFYLLQRLELINDKALQHRLETVCRQMIMSMGKIIVYSAQYDLSLVSFPTHFLTKFGLKAQQHHFDEVAVLTTSTLLEIGKTIVTEIDITYAELQEPFRSIINGLDALAKATFKKNKTINIKTLIQPFIDLRTLFQSEKMTKHHDTPAILAEIDRVLEEFSVLEQVMQVIPPLSETDLTESSENPDRKIPPFTVV